MASPIVNFDPKARDIYIDFADSCNCCHFIKPGRIKHHDIVHVNDQYFIIKHSQTPADHLTINTYRRMESLVQTIAIENDLDINKALDDFKKECTFLYDNAVKEVEPITFGRLGRMMEAAKRALKEVK